MNSIVKNRNTKLKFSNIIKKKVEEIRLNNTSGSLEIAKEAADLLIFLVDNYDFNSRLKLINLINETVYELVKAQPSMASIFNLGNIITLNILNLEDIHEIKNNLNQTCQIYRKLRSINGINRSKDFKIIE